MGFDGYAFTSRRELRDSRDEPVRGVLRGSRLVGEIDSMRFLRPDVAVLHCRGGVVTDRRSTLGRGRESVHTIVAQHVGDRWHVADFRNTRYRPLNRLVRWYLRRAAARAGTDRRPKSGDRLRCPPLVALGAARRRSPSRLGEKAAAACPGGAAPCL